MIVHGTPFIVIVRTEFEYIWFVGSAMVSATLTPLFEVVWAAIVGIFGINEYEQSLIQTLFNPFTVTITCGEGATENNIL
jgi:hypothetical protein